MDQVETGPSLSHLHDILIFLIAAGLVVPIVHRFKISPVLGFLGVGLIIGPHGLGYFTTAWPWLSYALISNEEIVHFLAELGVVFLLFTIGLHLSLPRLWAMRRLVFGLGGLQVVVTTSVIAGLLYLFGNPLETGLIVGAALSLSSTAIVMQLLSEKHRLSSVVGHSSFAVLLFQDLAVVPILFAASALDPGANESTLWSDLAVAITSALLAIALILLAGRIVIRPLFRMVSSANNPELFMAAVLLIVLGTGALTSAAGLSLALGAFLAGLMFADTEYRHGIEVDIAPFKGLLLGLFFMSVGMEIDLSVLFADPLPILIAVLALILLKALILTTLGVLFGLPLAVAMESGLLLGQAGEFAFVIVGAAVTMELAGLPDVQFVLIVTGLTMLLTPGLATLARRLGAAIAFHTAHRPALPLPGDGERRGENHVIIAGFGRVGHILASLLDRLDIPYSALDTDASALQAANTEAATLYFGDASRPEILRRMGLSRAVALAVTTDAPQAAERIIATARRERPDLPIFVRARDPAHARALHHLGATQAIPEVTEPSLELGYALLQQIGVPNDTSLALIEEQREQMRQAL